ncbi:hypothetical protein ACSTAT_001534 [Vibrio cholerae]
MNKNGFTLFEALLSVMVLGSISTGIILKEVENRNQNERLRFIDEAMSIVKAVDHRIAIDGYDPDLWTKLKWDNEEEIVNSLIKEDLTSQYHDKCSGGNWKPAISAENNTKLISCNLWGSRRNFGETIKAELREDSFGFIQGFDLLISFDDEANFKKYFRDIKYSLNQISVNPSQELSGIYINSLVSTSSGVDIDSYECINNPLDCSIKLSLERSGGNEYIRADGGNSMIGAHLTFIESKGQSPLKCLRWSNTQRDGSGVWSKVDDEDCGIGIYEQTGQPVMVDVVADTGTFKNVVLDKLCKVYQWNGSEVADAGISTPCGMTNNGTEIYQITNRVIANELESVNIKGSNINAKNLKVNIANIDQIITPILNAEYIEVSKQLEVKGNSFLRGDLLVTGNTTMNGNLDLSGVLSGGKSYFTELNSTDATISNNLKVDETTETKNLKVNNTLTATTANLSTTNATNLTVSDTMKVNKRATEGEACSDVGLLATTTTGDLLTCVSGKWKKQGASVGTWVFKTKSCVKNTTHIGLIIGYPIEITNIDKIENYGCAIGTRAYHKLGGCSYQGNPGTDYRYYICE